MKLYIYNENCTLAGEQVTRSRLEAYDGDVDEAGDWTCFEGEPQELLSIAKSMEQTDGAPGRANRFGRKVAKTLREAVYFEKPELEPEEVESE